MTIQENERRTFSPKAEQTISRVEPTLSPYRKGAIELVNLWRPYDFYITIRGKRGTNQQAFLTALRRLLRIVNRTLFGRSAEHNDLELAPHRLGKAACLIGYTVIENLNTSGNRCQIHAHITCRPATGIGTVQLEDVQAAFAHALTIPPVARLDVFDANAPGTLVAKAVEGGDMSGSLARYNTKTLDFLIENRNTAAVGIYSMFGRKIERLF